MTCDNQLKFSATPLLGTLQRNVPGSLHSLAIAWSAPGFWLSWGRFSEAIQTGQSQTVPALGAKIWDYYAQQPEEGAAFTKAMHGITSGIAQEVARVVDTSTAKLAIDVGGASGTLVHSLMTANPQLYGIILDLPDVVPSATAAASALGLAKRSRALAGNFFDNVPEGDIYLLKHILHDCERWASGPDPGEMPESDAARRSGDRDRGLLGEISEPGLAPARTST